MGRIYVNNYASATTADITDSATIINIASSTGLPTLGSGEYYYLTLGNGTSVEIVKVTARTSLALTVVRAQESTTAIAWSSGTPIEMRATAHSYNSITTPTENSRASWDTNLNLSANNHLSGYATTATAAGNTTLTVASAKNQFFTGSTTQNCILPVVSTLALGHEFVITNNSSGVVTVKSSGSNTIYAQPAGTKITYTCILTSGTSAASWSHTPFVTSPGGSTTQVQYNSGGAFAGHSGFTYDGSGTATLTTAIVVGGNSTAAGYIRLLEDSDNGSNYTGFAAPSSLAGNIVYTMPSADGTTGQLLKTDGSGTLSWVDPSAASLSGTMVGDINVGGYKFVSSANGNIVLEPNGTGAVLIGGNSTQPAQLRLMEDSDNGTNYTGFVAPSSLAGNVVYTMPSADGTSGQLLSTNGSGTLSWATSASGAVDVQVFTSAGAGTWTKPSGCTMVEVVMYGAGGGGGGGSSLATAVAARGGAGGGGGAQARRLFRASNLSATESVSVGTGGAGGAGGTAGGAGASGSVGGNSTFGTTVLLTAYGGGGGRGGQTTATAVSGGGGGGTAGAGGTGTASSGTGGLPGSSVTSALAGQGAAGGQNTVPGLAEFGGGGGGANSNGITNVAGGSSLHGGGGGGAGGCHTATPAVQAGTDGGGVTTYVAGGGGAVGTDGASPTAGTAGTNGTLAYGGTGGGGGGTTVTAATAGAAGGAGGTHGGGGGGGGVGMNPGVGGDGGAGGNGAIYVISW